METNTLLVKKKFFIELESIHTVSDKVSIAYSQRIHPDDYNPYEHDNDEFEDGYAPLEFNDYLYLALNTNLEKLHGLKTKKDLNIREASDSNLFSFQNNKIEIYDW